MSLINLNPTKTVVRDVYLMQYVADQGTNTQLGI